MTLAQLVPNLELCKELKENGYPQKTQFYWRNYGNFLLHENEWELVCSPNCSEGGHQSLAAPTASEIGEQLTEGLFSIDKLEGKWGVYRSCFFDVFYDEQLSNALAKMWIFFKKNNLLEEAT